jgi:hypothetical protein
MTGKPFVAQGIESSCGVVVPDHLLGAWSEPYSILISACAVVIAVASRPLFVGITKRVFAIILEKIQNSSPPPKDGVEEGDTSVEGNPMHELRKAAKAKAVGKLEDIESGIIEDINSISEEVAGDSTKKHFKEPDHASAVFYNLVSLVMAMTAFMQYWMSEEVNFMDISLFSGNQSVECRCEWEGRRRERHRHQANIH